MTADVEDRPSAAAAARAILDAEAEGRALAEVVALTGPAAGLRVLMREDGELQGTLLDEALDAFAVSLGTDLLRNGGTRLETCGDVQLFGTAHRPAERLVIVGAGHIAVPLAELGVRVGFAVTVLDDREEFATAERFLPEARVLVADFTTDPFAAVRFNGRTFVALVTRGHRWDFDCLQRLLTSGARPVYVGMIGSRRRVRAALQSLLRAGIPRERLATVRAPIGLEIGAETPAEIAVSIVAEMIAVRRGVDVPSITTRERVLERLLPEGEEAHG